LNPEAGEFQQENRKQQENRGACRLERQPGQTAKIANRAKSERARAIFVASGLGLEVSHLFRRRGAVGLNNV
jgi:hypothetical protein